MRASVGGREIKIARETRVPRLFRVVLALHSPCAVPLDHARPELCVIGGVIQTRVVGVHRVRVVRVVRVIRVWGSRLGRLLETHRVVISEVLGQESSCDSGSTPLGLAVCVCMQEREKERDCVCVCV